MRRHLLPVLVAAAAAVLAGCGGSGSTTTGRVAQSPRTGTDAASKPATPDRQGDRAIARAALVRLSDLPAGWAARPDTSNHFHCPAIDAAERNPNARSDRFDGDAQSAQHETIVLTTDDAADAALDALVSHATLDCLAQQGEASVRSQVSAGTEVGHVTATRFDVPSSGDRTVGVRLVYPVSANGLRATAYEDLVLTRVGRGLSLFAFVAQDATPDESLRSDLSRRGAQRLSDALGSA